MRIEFEGQAPRIDASAWVAATATVIGSVDVGVDASIWFGAVVRGDIAPIRIGARTNVQDNAIIHVTAGRHPTAVGNDVTIGHGAIVHGCTVGDGCLIGMGAVVMDGVTIGDQTLIGAGSLVTPGTVIPGRTLALGRPARVVHPLSDGEIAEIVGAAARYVALAARHREAGRVRPGVVRPDGSEDGS